MSSRALVAAASLSLGAALAYALTCKAARRRSLARRLHGATLHFFPLSGRAECIRLALAIAGIEFDDSRFAFGEWGALKPTTTWASVPLLELKDGTRLGQARAILRFVGEASGLYPSDALLAQRVDEVIDAAEDVLFLCNATGQGLELSEKIKLRQESAASGKIGSLLSRIDKFIAEHGRDGFAVGSSLTIADLWLFNISSSCASGFLDGMSEALIVEPYESLKAVRTTVANVPAVRKWYDEQVGKPYMEMLIQGKTLASLYKTFYDARG